MITLTRKMFTMILSVVVYNHSLTKGQWLGAATVFAGITVEAWVKRKGNNVCKKDYDCLIELDLTEIHAKRVLQEKEKAKIKQL